MVQSIFNSSDCNDHGDAVFHAPDDDSNNYGDMVTCDVFGDEDLKLQQEDLLGEQTIKTTTSGQHMVDFNFGQKFMGLHVIFNKYQRLLVRQANTFYTTKNERNFTERILSMNNSCSVPLAYPEGALFPSIFWRMAFDGSIVGALPGALLTDSTTLKANGFASLYDHMQT